MLILNDWSIQTDQDTIIQPFHLHLKKGEIVGLIGESGSGKTTLARSLVGLTPFLTKGTYLLEGQPMQQNDEREWNRIRMLKVSLAFQNTLELFHPMYTIEKQLDEPLRRLTSLSKIERKRTILSSLQRVLLDETILKKYPHELSGGMLQRIFIAHALLLDPDVLLLDEPTMALDPPLKKEMIQLFRSLREEGMAILFISHELSLVRELTDRVLVLYKGFVVEEGKTADVFQRPEHPYTKGLLSSSPDLVTFRNLRYMKMPDQETNGSHCPFFSRCTQRSNRCLNEPIPIISKNERAVRCIYGGSRPILSSKGLSKSYGSHIVFKNLSFTIATGETTVILGPSGSGKSTFARILATLEHPTSGSIFFFEKEASLYTLSNKYGHVQYIHQDPTSSLPMHRTVKEAIVEPCRIQGRSFSLEKLQRVLLLTQLPTSTSFLNRSLRSLSGGQLQRIAIARSLMMEPRLLIADEITSMLDASTASSIVYQLQTIQIETGLTIIWITHDIPLAKKIADTTYILKNQTLQLYK